MGSMCSGVGFSCVCNGLYLNEKMHVHSLGNLGKQVKFFFSFDPLRTKLFVDAFCNDTI